MYNMNGDVFGNIRDEDEDDPKNENIYDDIDEVRELAHARYLAQENIYN